MSKSRNGSDAPTNLRFDSFALQWHVPTRCPSRNADHFCAMTQQLLNRTAPRLVAAAAAAIAARICRKLSSHIQAPHSTPDCPAGELAQGPLRLCRCSLQLRWQAASLLHCGRGPRGMIDMRRHDFLRISALSTDRERPRGCRSVYRSEDFCCQYRSRAASRSPPRARSLNTSRVSRSRLRLRCPLRPRDPPCACRQHNAIVFPTVSNNAEWGSPRFIARIVFVVGLAVSTHQDNQYSGVPDIQSNAHSQNESSRRTLSRPSFSRLPPPRSRSRRS